MDDELDTLTQMARSPQHYSNYALSAALHTALDRLDDANAETLRLASALAGVREALLPLAAPCLTITEPNEHGWANCSDEYAFIQSGEGYYTATTRERLRTEYPYCLPCRIRLALAALPPGGGDT